MSDARPDDDWRPAGEPSPSVWAAPVPAPGGGPVAAPMPEWGSAPVPPPAYGASVPPPPVYGAAVAGPPGAGPPPGTTVTSSGPPRPGSRATRGRNGSGLRSAVEWAVIIAVALIGALVIRTVLFQAFFIPSASMTPTLKVHDRILVNKLSYHLHPVHRGDIVVFKRSPNMAEAGIKDLVKRVIGLPGETIASAPDGQILIDGQALSEPYLPANINMGPPVPKQVIPAGEYWVMGDNRDDSADSRVFGPIKRNQIVGRAFILIWPIPDFRLL